MLTTNDIVERAVNRESWGFMKKIRARFESETRGGLRARTLNLSTEKSAPAEERDLLQRTLWAVWLRQKYPHSWLLIFLIGGGR